MAFFLDLVYALFVGALLYVALYGLLRYGDSGSLHRPVRTEQAVQLIAIAGGAAQVFATHSWPLGIAALLLLSALAFLLRRLVARYTVPSPVPAGATLLLYRGQVLPAALMEAGLNEAELRRRLLGQGILDLTQLHAIIQEVNGQLGVIQPSAPHLFRPVLHAN